MINIAYHPIYKHPLPDNHKFPMRKYSELADRLASAKYFSKDNFFQPTFEVEEYICLAHKEEYFEKAKSLNLTKSEERRLGFPQSRQLFERELLIADGTTKGGILALDNGLSFNIAGGTHHAFTYKGEGFCMFNDIAVAANLLLYKKLAKRVLVIDLDVHQGNGTAEIFKNNTNVYTLSIHGKNNYPLKKEKSDLDIEFEDLTSDDEYIKVVNDLIPKLIYSQKPDVVFYLAGADILETDKFGRLSVSIAGAKLRDEIVFSNCRKEGIPVVCVMGGGYSKDLEVILEAHLNTFEIGKEIYS